MSSRRKRSYRHAALLRYAKHLGFGEIHEKIHAETGLHALIAIHSTKLGPAIGGTRFFPYSSPGAATKDALRLAYMMTLKSAVCGLPHGGAKAVIIQPPVIQDRKALFEVYGDFVHALNGRYIAAIDVGTSTTDMDNISLHTPYVVGATRFSTADSDPAQHTVHGLMRGIEAAVHFVLRRDTLAGLHCAVQGLGSVGYHLVKSLCARGASVTVCDPNPLAVQHCVEDFPVKVVPVDQIYSVACDIFSPCALGGVLTAATVRQLRCKIIAGSANNQLAHTSVSALLQAGGMTYVPDYLINAGGLINAAMVYAYQDPARAETAIDKLYGRTLEVLERAQRENKTTTMILDTIARESLGMGDQTG